MKRTITCLFLALVVSMINLPSAMAASEASLKVGVLDVGQVLQHSPQMEVMAEQLKKRFKPRQDKIAAMQKRIEQNEAKMKRDATVMSKNDLKKTQESIASDQRDLRRLQEDYIQDARTAQKESMDKIMEKVNTIVQSIADNEHYDLILQRNNVAFASNRVDITERVLTQLKKNKS